MSNNQKESEADNRLYDQYLNGIIHRWLEILYFTGFVLNPIFLILDYFTLAEGILPDFVLYRSIATFLLIIGYFIIKATRPSEYSIVFGYIFSYIVSVMIVIMTVRLGGFDSSYYAGLNLVIIGVNLLIPWNFYHSAANGISVVFFYFLLNLVFPQHYELKNMVNNLYFLSSTVIATVIINYFHLGLIKTEYMLRQDLHRARDALWSEMEIAKKIQTSLLPHVQDIKGYKISSTMIPADEVGGDYFDIIDSGDSSFWVAIGDVSGHGFESGLIMMMAQNVILSTISYTEKKSPSDILVNVNRVLNRNIQKLNVDRYMTLLLMNVDGNKITISGRHLDIMVYRNNEHRIEIVSEPGTYMGLVDDVVEDLSDSIFTVERGDVILLYTDGITEAFDKDGNMFCNEALEAIFMQNAELPIDQIAKNILMTVQNFQEAQIDDISLFVMKKK